MTQVIPPLSSLAELDTAISAAARQLSAADEAWSVVERSTPRRDRFGSDAGYEAELVAYLERVRAPAEATAERAAQLASDTARAALDQVERAPMAALSTADAARADALSAVVRDEVERLTWPNLVDRVKDATLTGDRAAQALYIRYGRMALAGHGSDGLLPEAAAARDAFANALATLQSRFADTGAAQTRERATKLLAAARALEGRAQARKRANERYRFQGEHDVRW